MAKIKMEYETEYDINDVVVFLGNDEECYKVGIVRKYYCECGQIFYTIQISKDVATDWGHGGEIDENRILCKLDGKNAEKCRGHIVDLTDDYYSVDDDDDDEDDEDEDDE